MAEAEHDQKTLLLVEDDEAFARTLRRSFERRGYIYRPRRERTFTAGRASGSDGLAQAH